MPILIKLKQYKNRTKSSFGKYYASTVRGEEVHTPELAERICRNTTFKPSEVSGILQELVEEMTLSLQDGQTVVLDGFGRFRLMAESDGVENPKSFNLQKHIRKVVCKFLPEGRRTHATGNPADNSLKRTFSESTKVAWFPGAKP